MRYLTLILLFCLPFTSMAATVAVPTLQQRVTDDARVLSPREVEQINRQIVTLEKNRPSAGGTGGGYHRG